jgi:cytochrome oxidase Cu insertion factor (SCO1/SenC/PrrC family)
MKRYSLLAMALCLSFAVAHTALAGPGIGDPAPGFTLLDVNGNPVSLSEFEGQVVALNFWASW